jgi:hypothetical protein
MLRYELSAAHHFSAPGRGTASSPVSDRSGPRSSREGGWLESSWDLSDGLEISSLDGELPEEFFRQPSAPGG